LIDIIGGDNIENTKLKTITLGLVHLKRLDIGTENSIKVFKVKKFY
jgi:hypothetical protein